MHDKKEESTAVPDTTLIELHALVPITDNQGCTFPPEYFRTFDHFLVRSVGGFTRAGIRTGAWRAPNGDIVHDDSAAYFVTCERLHAASISAKLQTLIKVLFEQEAAFIQITEVRRPAEERS